MRASERVCSVQRSGLLGEASEGFASLISEGTMRG